MEDMDEYARTAESLSAQVCSPTEEQCPTWTVPTGVPLLEAGHVLYYLMYARACIGADFPQKDGTIRMQVGLHPKL
jgi:hypothetical protein